MTLVPEPGTNSGNTSHRDVKLAQGFFLHTERTSGRLSRQRPVNVGAEGGACGRDVTQRGTQDALRPGSALQHGPQNDPITLFCLDVAI